MSLRQWFEDSLWASRMKRARQLRRRMCSDQRLAFDQAMRPNVINGGGKQIPWPDSIYQVSAKDLRRAIKTARQWR